MSSYRDNAQNYRSRLSGKAATKLPLDDTTGSNNNKKIIAGFEVQNRLGSGSFASVYKGVKKLEDGRLAEVAIKAISRKGKRLTPKILENLELEISILKTYRHRNIVVLHNVQKTDRHFYLLLEYCGGGDLQQLIRTRKKKRLSEGLSRRLMRDLTSGLKFLWGQSIIHRDVKPQNLLLSGPLPLDELYDQCEKESDEKARLDANFPSSQFALKIADFGFARPLEKASLAETLCGSPLYMAPEILEGLKYDAKADLWSVGTVLFEMVTGRPPFMGDNHIHLLRNIKTKSLRLPEGVKVSQECVDLLKVLLNRNPSKRADFASFSESSDKFVALGCAGTLIIDENNTCPQHDFGRMAPVAESSSSRESMETNVQSNSNATALSSQVETPRSPVQILDDNQMMSATPPAPPAPFNLSSNPAVISCSKQQPSYQLSEKQKSYHHFAPLHPSPPGPVIMKKMEISKGSSSPPFVLDSSESTRSFLQVANIPPPPPLFQREQTKRTCNAQCLHSNSKTESSTSDSEFVMVEHGSGNVSPSVSVQAKNGEQVVHVRQRNQSLITFSNSRPSCSDNSVRGILDTSPETGTVLLAMMTTSGMTSSHSFNRIQRMRNANLSTSSDIELAAKMLAAAEDIGRRAVNVAHLGDTRAYLAMRKDAHLEGSSSTCFSPMEDDNIANERSRRNGINNSMSMCQLTSSSDKNGNKNEVVVDDDDDEMPFAINTSPDDMPDLVKPCHGSSRMSSFREHSLPAPKKTDQMYVSQPLTHFQEALTCYVKAMSLMKCAVHTIQMIMDKVGVNASNNIIRGTDNGKTLLMQRCQTSFQWLGGQFTGVLERANAANLEVRKLSSNTSMDGAVSTSQHKLGVEELIYNHALACGRDGAVKQLLGHYDAAKTFYRSAGILIETLLMEQRVVGEDRKMLLEYMEGFSERIRELDSASISKRGSRRGSINFASGSFAGGLKGGSAVVGLVGGVIPFQQHGVNRYIPESQKSIPYPSVPTIGME